MSGCKCHQYLGFQDAGISDDHHDYDYLDHDDHHDNMTTNRAHIQKVKVHSAARISGITKLSLESSFHFHSLCFQSKSIQKSEIYISLKEPPDKVQQ